MASGTSNAVDKLAFAPGDKERYVLKLHREDRRQHDEGLHPYHQHHRVVCKRVGSIFSVEEVCGRGVVIFRRSSVESFVDVEDCCLDF
jgi:hypothetical protein